MGPEAAVGLLHRRELAGAPDPRLARRELAASYRETMTGPFVAAEAGIIDDVILPEETRERLIAVLRYAVQPRPVRRTCRGRRPGRTPRIGWCSSGRTRRGDG